jgi:hypothetical protein
MLAMDEVARIRRQQVVNLSMTELMLLLVFMAITFSFLSKEEGLTEVTLFQKERDEARALNVLLRAHISELDLQIRELVRERDEEQRKAMELDRRLRELLPEATAPSPNPAHVVSIPQVQLDGLNNRVVVQNRVIAGRDAEIADLRKQIGGKAPGLPTCSVTSRNILSFLFRADGMIVGARAWDSEADSVANNLPGMSVLASGMPLTHDSFAAAAKALSDWGRAQNPSCALSVLVRHDLTSAKEYDRKLDLVQRFFRYQRAGG